jgi:hypothetical protein
MRQETSQTYKDYINTQDINEIAMVSIVTLILSSVSLRFKFLQEGGSNKSIDHSEIKNRTE